MNRREAIESMLKQHREGVRPIRWFVMNTPNHVSVDALVGVGAFGLLGVKAWMPMACTKPWLEVTPEQLDDIIAAADDPVAYLENCFE